jgi:hypothetical protein
MVRFFAILLVVVIAVAAWLTSPLWQGDDGPSEDVPRIPASERLAAVARARAQWDDWKLLKLPYCHTAVLCSRF